MAKRASAPAKIEDDDAGPRPDINPADQAESEADLAVAPADAPPDGRAIDPAEAETLLRSGHKLYRRGDDPADWVTIVRLGDGSYALACALTPERLSDIISEDLLLAPDPAP